MDRSNYHGHEEWQAWQQVVEGLKSSGAVIDADCTSLATLRETPGQRLFATIREWGEKYAALVAANNESEEEEEG